MCSGQKSAATILRAQQLLQAAVMSRFYISQGYVAFVSAVNADGQCIAVCSLSFTAAICVVYAARCVVLKCHAYIVACDPPRQLAVLSQHVHGGLSCPDNTDGNMSRCSSLSTRDLLIVIIDWLTCFFALQFTTYH